jgi:hypothetical protein
MSCAFHISDRIDELTMVFEAPLNQLPEVRIHVESIDEDRVAPVANRP